MPLQNALIAVLELIRQFID
ncbi:DinQ-like type I toxin DqlB [Escherichia coli]